MSAPVRLQLSRRKGFDLQAQSHAANGLPAVNVARPGKYGNPFRVTEARAAEEAAEMFRQNFIDCLLSGYWRTRRTAESTLTDLRGKNLACWCKLDAPCHADVLLELANRPVCNEITP